VWWGGGVVLGGPQACTRLQQKYEEYSYLWKTDIDTYFKVTLSSCVPPIAALSACTSPLPPQQHPPVCRLGRQCPPHTPLIPQPHLNTQEFCEDAVTITPMGQRLVDLAKFEAAISKYEAVRDQLSKLQVRLFAWVSCGVVVVRACGGVSCFHTTRACLELEAWMSCAYVRGADALPPLSSCCV
jgi:hypothetical protein